MTVVVVVTDSLTGAAGRVLAAEDLPGDGRLREDAAGLLAAASGGVDGALVVDATADASSLSTDSRAARLVGAGGKGMWFTCG